MSSLHDPHELAADTQQVLTELRELEEAPDPGTAAPGATGSRS